VKKKSELKGFFFSLRRSRNNYASFFMRRAKGV
jgi:hypothetical protein